MTVSTMPKRTESADWGRILVQGVLLALVGLALMISPQMSVFVLVSFLGAYWLVSGVFSLTRLFTHEGRTHWGWNFAGGILGVIAGLIVLRHPLYAGVLLPTFLVIILGINALAMGVVSLVRAFTGDGFSAAAIGVIDIILGVMLLGSPLIAASIFPVVLGIFALIGGIGLTVTAFSARNQDQEKDMAEPSATRRRAA